MASGGVNRMRVWKVSGRQLALMQARDMHERRIVLDGGGGGAGATPARNAVDRLHGNGVISGFAGYTILSSWGALLFF